MSALRSGDVVHFLHIGKTGGTAIIHVIERDRAQSPYVLVDHTHQFTLRDVPAGEKAVFMLRDPVSRFVSGFYSRQREGRPRYVVPWSLEEADAFEHFHTPNQLGLALASTEPGEVARAEAAMANIKHVKTSFWDWLDTPEYLHERSDAIVFIGFQESLVADFERLKALLVLPAGAELPADDVDAHKNPEDLDRRLDDVAAANLRHWYREDYHCLDLCRELAAAGSRVERGVSGLRRAFWRRQRR